MLVILTLSTHLQIFKLKGQIAFFLYNFLKKAYNKAESNVINLFQVMFFELTNTDGKLS